MPIAISFSVTTALATCCLWLGSRVSCGSAKVVDLLITRVENVDSWPDAVVMVAVTSIVAPLASRMLLG